METRQEALGKLSKLSDDELEAFAIVAETAEVQGDYYFNGEGSVYEDSASGTLNSLAAEIRNLKRG